MKELLVTIGLIILGGIIVSTLILGDAGLQNAAESVVGEGLKAIQGIKFQ